jgi:hypothetical protein
MLYKTRNHSNVSFSFPSISAHCADYVYVYMSWSIRKYINNCFELLLMLNWMSWVSRRASKLKTKEELNWKRHKKYLSRENSHAMQFFEVSLSLSQLFTKHFFFCLWTWESSIKNFCVHLIIFGTFLLKLNKQSYA